MKRFFGGNGMSMLIMKELTKMYGNFTAVKQVNLEMEKGELLTLLGPSGSGKTTILKMVAGLEIPTEGEIIVNGKNITFLPPHLRGLGMVFQNYALFPHMNVQQNIAFPLKMQKKYSPEVILKKTKDILTLVQLEEFMNRFPSQLSGGQQQRVALARALVFQPPIVLMDEPLGALDKNLRSAMQLEIKRIQQELELTMIYVTHDQEEALNLSDRIAIIHDGIIEQIDRPHIVYENPINYFVAGFIGDSNFLPVTKIGQEGSMTILRLQSSQGSVVKVEQSSDQEQGEELHLFIRPEKVIVRKSLQPNQRKLQGVIEEVIYLGEIIKYQFKVDNQFIMTAKQQTREENEVLTIGDQVDIGWSDNYARLLRKEEKEV